jgi:hypothetical protein
MFTTHRAIDDCGSGSLCDRARSPDRHRTVDDRQLGLEQFDIASSFADEILNLERVADVEHFDRTDGRHGGNVHSKNLLVLGNEFKERLPHLAESNNNDFIG